MNTTTANAAPTPVLFVLWHREHRRGARWKKAGRYGSRAEALTAIGGAGDWHIAELHDPALDGGEKTEKQPALFE